MVLLTSSLAIAIPLTIFLMKGWLSTFAYFVSINSTPFISATFIVTIVFIGSAILQTLRRTLINPSEVLKEN